MKDDWYMQGILIPALSQRSEERGDYPNVEFAFENSSNIIIRQNNQRVEIYDNKHYQLLY